MIIYVSNSPGIQCHVMGSIACNSDFTYIEVKMGDTI